MNERIRELMPKPWTFPYPDRELYTKEQFEKFAELIVRECMNICAEREEDIRIRIKDERQAATAYMCRAYIKEHFGVE